MALGILKKISKTAYQKALARAKKTQGYWRRHASYGRGGGSSMSAEKAKGLLKYGSEKRRNRDQAVIEVYQLQNRKKAGPIFGYLKGHKITNWTGIRICTVTKRSSGSTGFPDRAGHRPKRVSVTATCIDGRKYVGSGPGDSMYVRLRPKKGR